MINYLFGIIVLVFVFKFVKYINNNVSSKPAKLLYFQIIYNCFIKFFIGILSFPAFLNYLNDVLLIIVLVYYFLYKKNGVRFNTNIVFKILFAIYVIICILSFFGNKYSILLFAWGARNNFRYLIYAYLCICFIKKEDLKVLYNILTGFLILNFFIIIYQSLTANYSIGAIGDYISGLYSNGENRGGNASLNWLLCIGCTYSLISYLFKELSFKHVALWIGCSIIIAALNETKLFFVEIALISILSFILCKKSLKSIMYSILIIVGLYYGIQLMYTLMPQFANFFNINNILNYVSHSYSHGGLSRFGAISYCIKHFLTNKLSLFLGIGLGNADYSSYSFLTSQFYSRYGDIGYTFFSSSMTIIEVGILGLISYLAIFINYGILSITLKSHDNNEKIWKYTSLIVFLIAVISFFSNQTLRLESSAFLVHFILVIPIILKLKKGEEL